MGYYILYQLHVKEEVMAAASSQFTTMKEANSECETNTWKRVEWKNWVTDI